MNVTPVTPPLSYGLPPTQSVLVVEDDQEIGHVVEEILTDYLSLEVVRVSNADDALHELSLRAFDLVFTDIVMPGTMNGVDLAKRIRSQNPGQAIVLSTGNAPAAYLGDISALGLPLLRKPYRIAHLQATIQAALDTV